MAPHALLCALALLLLPLGLAQRPFLPDELPTVPFSQTKVLADASHNASVTETASEPEPKLPHQDPWAGGGLTTLDRASGSNTSDFNSSGAANLGSSWLSGMASTFPNLAAVLASNRIVGGAEVPQLRQAVFVPSPPSPANTTGYPAPDYRIVGGAAVPIPRYPYMTSFRDANNRHFCGGSLIHPRAVLTAAHCLKGSDSPGVQLPTVEIGRLYSSTPEQNYIRLRCSSIVVHEYWSTSGGQGDLALCLLPDDVTTITPVTLAGGEIQDANTALTVIGWGAQQEGGGNSDTLQEVQVYLQDLDSCNATYNGRLSTLQICAGVPQGGKDACQGDSGGPLIVAGSDASQDMQYGLVSWGQGCAEPGKPGVYTKLSAYIPWINDKLQTNFGSSLPGPATTGTADAASAPADGSTSTTVDGRVDPCACTQDGRSGNMSVTQIGCKQHGLAANDAMYYCYTESGLDCQTASSSSLYGGHAGWRECNPTSDNPTQTTTPAVQAFDNTTGGQAVQTPAPAPATSTPAPIWSQLTSALVSLIG